MQPRMCDDSSVPTSSHRWTCGVKNFFLGSLKSCQLRCFAEEDKTKNKIPGVVGFVPISGAEMKSSFGQLDRRVDTESGGFSIKNAPDKTVKKHKQGLSKALRAFFNLKDDPIQWTAEESCYRCRFTLPAENPVQ